jgi:hypothetical protein
LSPISEKAGRSGIRHVAREALLELMQPLAGFVLDSGLSAGELQAIFREAAVKSAAARQLETSPRVNVSGIAATTGIPRAEISRILRVSAKVGKDEIDNQQQSTNRILAAWHQDPKFTDPNGQPADLKMFGRGATFEALARKYGLGIPTRAVLDELLRSGAIELLAQTQKVRAKTSMAVERGISSSVIKAFGNHATELLSTMLLNMRQPESPKFIASVSNSAISPSSLPLLRRELASKASDFLADVQEGLPRRTALRDSKRMQDDGVRISVTVFYHESFNNKKENGVLQHRRRNFRRQS